MAYKLTGIKYDDNFDICGFGIQNVIDSKVVDFEQLDELINSGSIVGAEILTDENNNKHIQYLDGDLSDLPIIYQDNSYRKGELTAVAVLLQNNEPYGYRFRAGDQFKNYSLQVTWELARRGCIANLKAGYEDDAKVICGADSTNIWELPVINKE